MCIKRNGKIVQTTRFIETLLVLGWFRDVSSDFLRLFCLLLDSFFVNMGKSHKRDREDEDPEARELRREAKKAEKVS